MDVFKELIERINHEMNEFRGIYQDVEPMVVYNDWYKIGFHEAYFNMLSSNDWLSDQEFEREALWLAGQEAPVGMLYGEFLRSDGEMSFDWEDMLAFARTVSRERMQEMDGLDGMIAGAERVKKEFVNGEWTRDNGQLR